MAAQIILTESQEDAELLEFIYPQVGQMRSQLLLIVTVKPDAVTITLDSDRKFKCGHYYSR